MATASRIAAAVIEWLEPDLEGGVTDGLAEALADLLPVSAMGGARNSETSTNLLKVDPDRSCRCAPCPARWLRSPRTRARAQDTAGAQAAASWTASSIITSSWPPRAGDGRTSG